MKTQTQKLDLISGEIVCWNNSLTSKESLDKVCLKHDIKQNWAASTHHRALLYGLRDLNHTQGTLVRSGSKGTACVITESVDDDGNNYSMTARYRINEDWEVFSIDDAKTVAANETQAAQRYRNMCPASVVGAYLAQLLASNFKATRMRQSGGIYFVPAPTLKEWSAFATDFCKETGNTIYRIQCGVDANTATAVIDNAKEDLQTRYELTLDKLAGLEKPDPKTSTDAELKRYRKRKSDLMQALDDVKSLAATIDQSFGSLSGLTDEIKVNIDNDVAAVLLTLTKA